MITNRSTAYWALWLCLASPLISPAATPVVIPEQAMKTITVDDARTHLSMLAADSMMGRNTPSPQLDIAAQYIADRFREYGLQPVNGSYIKPYGLTQMNLGADNGFTIVRSDRTTTGEQRGAARTARDLEIKTDYVPYDFTAGTADSGEIVFAGYGITAPEFKWDDYAGIDVKGKFVLVLRHEPDERGADTTFFRGKKFTRYGEIRRKMEMAREHGAIGLIVVNDPANHMLLKPEGYPWPSLFFKSIRNEDLPVTLAGVERKSILAVHGGEAVITALFGSVDSLIAIQHGMDSTHTPHSIALAGISIAMHISLMHTDVQAPNVVGWLQGELTDSEHIVIGAHLDHVGTTHATTAGEDTIYNGADDNASGTTGMLEVARAFAAAPQKPRRSVLFVSFSGEEKGLYGSRAYVTKPAVTLAHCAAMVNMDMIGRNDPDSVELGGAGHSPELTQLAIQQNESVGMKIKMTDDFIGRSDQASFSKEKIPVLFFFTGEHVDYHKVGDSVDKINFEKLVRIAGWCFRASWLIANNDTRFAYKD